jgi:23S rRNA (cytosine1962-C5)-methyltransferase
MSTPESNYQLLDFGMGRKLEQFGQTRVDRPCPGANAARKLARLWEQSDISYGRHGEDRWQPNIHPSAKLSLSNWFCTFDGIRMLLKPTPAGQVGVFPEHWMHWSWLLERLAPRLEHTEAPRVLSLFAYTGATTLALARAGCAVTHVDASKPTVAWARENGSHSNLEDASIRWIVDDASTFVKRELKRNSKYEAIVLDPPTYGHGAKGNRWEIHKHLLPLLLDCWQLLSEQRCGLLLCGHSSHIAIRDVNQALGQQLGNSNVSNCEVTKANLVDSSGRKLDCGFAARYSFPQ